MVPNHSPWIHQLNRTRAATPLTGAHTADVGIVGGGIAGVVSAYFILKMTSKSVLLLEADKIAHGATGHNAGQVTSYFERPFKDIVREFGIEMAAEGQRSVEHAWNDIDEILADTRLATPIHRFTGYAGVSSYAQLVSFLESNRLRVEGGLQPEYIYVSKEWSGLADIPEEFSDLYTVIPHADILSLLQTETPSYIGVIAYEKGCMNSALFTEELVAYMLSEYSDRFSVYEESAIRTVHLKDFAVALEGDAFTVSAAKALLCTNGFENFSIVNEDGPNIDTSFHHAVFGRIGYMAGYIEQLNSSPTAISYFLADPLNPNDPTGESYFYLTRRPHQHEGQDSFNLVCAGGPESVLPNQALYSRAEPCRIDMREVLDQFLRDTYRHYPQEEMEYAFCWHGLMGYTPNGIRRVGYEPRNKNLLYNLGCNGVGILPSIAGAKRIAQLLSGQVLEPSIFDPKG